MKKGWGAKRAQCGAARPNTNGERYTEYGIRNTGIGIRIHDVVCCGGVVDCLQLPAECIIKDITTSTYVYDRVVADGPASRLTRSGGAARRGAAQDHRNSRWFLDSSYILRFTVQ